MEEIRKKNLLFPKSPWYPLTCKKGCRYRAGDDGGCNYIFMEGKMRGCEPGKDCTCYSTRTAARKKEDITLGGPDKRKENKGPWDHEKGYRMWKRGMSQAAIARELGINLGAVQWRKQRYWSLGRA